MNNADAWQCYGDYTELVSKVARQLAFAGAGLIWAASSGDATRLSFKVGLSTVVLYFVADLAQYICAAERWRRWTRKRETELWSTSGTIEGEYHVPASLDVPVRALWWAKIALLMATFACVGLALI